MNSFSIKLRSVGRKLGLHHLVYRVRTALKPNQAYEDRCFRALQQTVKPGDVVWDIGANVGLYTELFCKWVGPSGNVVAFEPNPEAMAQLENRLADCHWLSVEKVALGSREEKCTLVVGTNLTSGHVHYDAETEFSGESEIPIQVTTGDAVSGRLGKLPNVLKIDVEGLEEEVLLGLDRTLASPDVRAVLTEVHFQQLESRGQRNAPIRIEKLLKSKGFFLNWVDRNHLLASRFN